MRGAANMTKNNRIYIIGHPGAGKALLAKTLAEKIDWKFINADLELEAKVGLTTQEMLGRQGEANLQNCMSQIISNLNTQANIVVTTDANIVCDEKNRQLLSYGFVVYLKVSLPIQLERLSRHPLPLGIPLVNSDVNIFLEKLHHERDGLYEKMAELVVDSDDSALDDHVLSIVNALSINHVESSSISLDKKDFIIFHKKIHVPIHLSEQQALCVKLLAKGKSAKEIAQEMNISYRTVEGYIAKVAELLGCSSSKELITLYLDQPGSR